MRIIITLLCFSFLVAKAQDKYDYVWILNNGNLNNFIMIDWKNLKPDTSIFKSKSVISIEYNSASISDKDGNFKFFSNGCTIAGKTLYPLANGLGINPGSISDSYCFSSGTGTYPAYNNIVFLPKPKDSTRYFLFHTARVEFSDSNTVTYPFVWSYYSEVDSKQGNNGKVIKKNIQLGPRDSLSAIGPIACKHANGQDWWIIVPGFHCHCFYRTLLTPNGPQYIGRQNLSETGPRNYNDWGGQGTFSPDGNKYVRTDRFNGTFIYNFDRCTGLMSNPVFIDTLITGGYSGVAISPNSKYLYISNVYLMHQFDLSATDIMASKVQVGFIDTTFLATNGNHVNFYKCLLAPDNKIYVGSVGSTDWISVIHSPDEKGIACDFRQHDLKLPKNYREGLPNMPHYRMPPKDIICAPVIATSEFFDDGQFLVYPNPSNGTIIVQKYIPDENNSIWQLYDTQGKQVFTQSLQSEKTSLSLPAFLPQGIYFWRVMNGVSQLGKGKLVLVE